MTDGQGIPSSKVNKERQNLHLDKVQDFREIETEAIKKEYLPYVRRRGKRVLTNHFHHHRSRRLVVERTNSWHNRFRKLLVRYEKKLESYFVLVCLGCCIVIYRRIILGKALRFYEAKLVKEEFEKTEIFCKIRPYLKF